jgi:hypothetical protein
MVAVFFIDITNTCQSLCVMHTVDFDVVFVFCLEMFQDELLHAVTKATLSGGTKKYQKLQFVCHGFVYICSNKVSLKSC